MIQRRILLVLLAWFLLLAPVCSLGSGENEYNEEKMTTLTGEEVLLADRNDVYTDSEFGFGFVVPESMINLVRQGLLEIIPISLTASVITTYASELFELMAAFDVDNSTEEEVNAFREQIKNYAFYAAVILRMPPEDERTDEVELLDYIRETYAIVEEIASIDETIYYFAYNTDFSNVLFTDSEKTQTETLVNELKDFEKNVFVFNPVPYEEVVPDQNVTVDLSKFEAQTLDGKTVTESIFAEYKLTMVNIWATWCPPCIAEMPDLAKLHSSMLPEGTNMITILTDSDLPGGIEAAHEIINSSSGEFMTLLKNEDLALLLKTVSAIPTTIFVDSEGRMVGSAVLGAPGAQPADAYLSIIEQLLLQL